MMRWSSCSEPCPLSPSKRHLALQGWPAHYQNPRAVPGGTSHIPGCATGHRERRLSPRPADRSRRGARRMTSTVQMRKETQRNK